VNCVGNIGRGSMQQMLEGDVYKACQQAIVARKRDNCTACAFRGYCDSTPMHEHGSIVNVEGTRRCGVPHDTISAVHAELTDAGVDAAIVGEWAREWLAQPRAAIA
jgi:hypothetical protein